MGNGKKEWTMYIVNMLVALPVMGMLSCAVFFIGYSLLFPRSNPPYWAEFVIPILLDILFTTMYGIHQYRNIILEERKIRRIRDTVLLGGIMLCCFVFFIGHFFVGPSKENASLVWLLVMLAISVTVPVFLVVRLVRRR